MTDLGKILRRVIKEKVKQVRQPVALLFSGGTDSLTILWTLLDLGVKVRCYTFHLSYYESTDLKASKRACEFWNVPQVMVTEDKGETREQLKEVIRTIRSYRKTYVEVMYGYYFLIKQVKEAHVWTGLQADTLYGSNKNSAIRYGKLSAREFAAYRKRLLLNDSQEGLYQAQLIAKHFNKNLHAPYADEYVREYLLRYSWQELNRPKQKMPAVRSFISEFQKLPIYRHDDNMQCGSKIREHLKTYVKEYKNIYEEVFDNRGR